MRKGKLFVDISFESQIQTKLALRISCESQVDVWSYLNHLQIMKGYRLYFLVYSWVVYLIIK